MDLMRLAFEHSPKVASKIMKTVYLNDNKINKLLKQLTK